MDRAQSVIYVWLFSGLCGFISGVTFCLFHTGKVDETLPFVTLVMGLVVGIIVAAVYAIGKVEDLKRHTTTGIIIAVVLSALCGPGGPVMVITVPIISIVVKVIMLLGSRKSD